MKGFMHLNSCVYNVIHNQDGTTSHVMHQVNHPILCKDFSMHEYPETSPKHLIMQLLGNMEEENNVSVEDVLIYTCFPIKDKNDIDQYIMTVVTGITLKGIMPDLTKPIIRIKGDEDAINKTYEPIIKEVPFIFIMPNTNDYMFDISFSHVPATAVIRFNSDTTTTSSPSTSRDWNRCLPNGNVPDTYKEKVLQELYRQQVMHATNGGNNDNFVFNIKEAMNVLQMTKNMIEKYLTE